MCVIYILSRNQIQVSFWYYFGLCKIDTDEKVTGLNLKYIYTKKKYNAKFNLGKSKFFYRYKI